MSKHKKEQDISTEDLPQSEVFTRKEVFQHPQPADQGLPLRPRHPKKKRPISTNKKEEEKTSKEEGLNEQNSSGTAGAFEGFENQQE